MKFLIYSILILNVFSCGSGKEVQSTVKIDPKDTLDLVIDSSRLDESEMDRFFRRFEAAVLSHNPKRIMEFMDKDYKREQHDSFYRGRTNDFLNDFFSGYSSNETVFINGDFQKINAIKKKSVQAQMGFYNVEYELLMGSKNVTVRWTLIVKLDKRNIVFGLYGPVG